MKKETYSLRTVFGADSTPRHYEFVRDSDDFVLKFSVDYQYLYAFAKGYTFALNKSLIIW